jgi:hypothetical protein
MYTPATRTKPNIENPVGSNNFVEIKFKFIAHQSPMLLQLVSKIAMKIVELKRCVNA